MVTVPDFFQCPCKHFLLWNTFWDDAKAETYTRLARDNSFTTDTAIEILHVPDCPFDGWEEPVRRKTQLERSTLDLDSPSILYTSSLNSSRSIT